MSSLIVYQGKMTAGTYMVDENLYIVFPSGIKDGALAYVLGTWTKDASGTVNAPLTMVGYPLKLITEKEFYIVRNGQYYHLKVDISGDKLNVVLLNERDEPSSSPSTLTVLQLQVPVTLRALFSITDYDGAFEPLFTSRTTSLGDVVSLATRSGASGGGEWVYVPARRTLCWSLGTRELHLRDPRSRVGAGPDRDATSVLKIDKLGGETYKPYKGVSPQALYKQLFPVAQTLRLQAILTSEAGRPPK
ncbi:hypothetical protein EDB86DRAFT_3081109 [Lactarius hatsudake]|nr:hypothetical protein EDB86DRAFT_3081109 [Lactarius hatsudake]